MKWTSKREIEKLRIARKEFFGKKSKRKRNKMLREEKIEMQVIELLRGEGYR